VLLLAATSTKSKSGSSSEILLLIIAAVFLFLMFRRSGARRRAAAGGGTTLEVGRQVLLKAGIYGRIRGFDGDDVLVETAPGVVIKVVRAAIGSVLPLPESPEVAAAGRGTDASTSLDPAAPYDPAEPDPLTPDVPASPQEVPATDEAGADEAGPDPVGPPGAEGEAPPTS
jgi:preprotein translocase subunit YajC